MVDQAAALPNASEPQDAATWSTPWPGLTRALEKAPPVLFALYGGLMAFGAYFAMYAFRKPFTAAGFHDVGGWPFALDFKIALVMSQVIGYALAKVVGIKVISEMKPAHRPFAMLGLVGFAELALLGLPLLPAPLKPAMLFLNGLPLGMIWGLVFGFLEGRRISEVLGAILCSSFIVSSGVVKSVGKWLILQNYVDDLWMPAVTGLIFLPMFFVCTLGLACLPPPSKADEAARVKRAPMDGKARWALFSSLAPGLMALIVTYILLSIFRDFRDNFAAEIWTELGFGKVAEIFTLSEIPVTVMALLVMALLIVVKDNQRALMMNFLLVSVGLALLGLSTLAFQGGYLDPLIWMILSGSGLYMAYSPFNGILFDRLISATGKIGTAGFLIYVADANGYVGSVILLLFKNFGQVSLPWVSFLELAAYGTSVLGLVFMLLGSLYFKALAKSRP